jgi:hypothetical protein
MAWAARAPQHRVCCVIKDEVQLAETFHDFVSADSDDLNDIGRIKIERATAIARGGSARIGWRSWPGSAAREGGSLAD